MLLLLWPWDISDIVFVQNVQLQTLSRDLVTRWFVTKQRWLEILYQNQWALAQDTLNTRISLFFDSCCLRIPVLSLHLPLEITASQKMSLCYVPGKSCKGHYYTTDCWVELGNNAKLPAGKSHYYTNAKKGTRCGKYPKCRTGGRHSQSSGLSLQRKHQKAMGSSSGR